MNCYYCSKEARGVCRFCGAALCGDHLSSGRFVSGWQDHGPYGTLIHDVRYDYIVVENALWCGRCTIRRYYRPDKGG